MAGATARVDIPRGGPALPLTDDELLAKHRDGAHSRMQPEDIERSVKLVFGLEKISDIKALTMTLGA